MIARKEAAEKELVKLVAKIEVYNELIEDELAQQKAREVEQATPSASNCNQETVSENQSAIF